LRQRKQALTVQLEQLQQVEWLNQQSGDDHWKIDEISRNSSSIRVSSTIHSDSSHREEDYQSSSNGDTLKDVTETEQDEQEKGIDSSLFSSFTSHEFAAPVSLFSPPYPMTWKRHRTLIRHFQLKSQSPSSIKDIHHSVEMDHQVVKVASSCVPPLPRVSTTLDVEESPKAERPPTHDTQGSISPGSRRKSKSTSTSTRKKDQTAIREIYSSLTEPTPQEAGEKGKVQSIAVEAAEAAGDKEFSPGLRPLSGDPRKRSSYSDRKSSIFSYSSAQGSSISDSDNYRRHSEVTVLTTATSLADMSDMSWQEREEIRDKDKDKEREEAGSLQPVSLAKKPGAAGTAIDIESTTGSFLAQRVLDSIEKSRKIRQDCQLRT
jgi:hypothetical protein